MMLAKMPIWKKFGMKSENTDQHDEQHEPDEIVENELERGASLAADRGARANAAESPVECQSVPGHAAAHRGAAGPLAGACKACLFDRLDRCRSAASGCPRSAGSSTLSLVIAAPGILMFGPQALVGHARIQAEHVIVAGLDLLLVDDLVGEHGERRGLGVQRLLDLDLLPALADEVEADRRAVRARRA